MEKDKSLRQAVQALIFWFRKHKRDLPWRKNADPYKILVSEFLLQQTTVPVAVRYYESFLTAFPTLESLAQASLEEVLRVWSGAGYYARARNLRETAIRLVATHGGVIPQEVSELKKLPGIGDYTARAIASFAFGADAIALDTNGIRVLARLLGKKGSPRRPSFRRELYQVAEILCPKGKASDFNQALMDLGSLICTASEPKCHQCCCSRGCFAFRSGRPQDFPSVPEKPTRQPLFEVACLIVKDGQFLVAQRAPGRWWGHLWEFPRQEINPNESSLAAVRRIAKEKLGLEVHPRAIVTTVRHSVTRYRIYLTGVLAEYQSGEPRGEGYVAFQWVSLADLNQLPSSSPQRRLVQTLLDMAREGSQFALIAEVLNEPRGQVA
ncbi:MAG: A/G-specific adenine glycosylase [Armatimonadetes bacterium]|nr:A/G-specific adenine glycosylase [Armatimonadota bacterium]MDW8121028.1 A/G-specific adenine glycosylase [Armatimonadota bacterium]